MFLELEVWAYNDEGEGANTCTQHEVLLLAATTFRSDWSVCGI